METILLVILVIVAVAMIGAVLIQRSEGGALGIGGGGGPGAMFSARGSANFLTRATAALGAAFMILSLVLAILGRDSDEGASVMDVPTEPLLEDSNALQPFDSEDYDPNALDGGLDSSPSEGDNIPESERQGGQSDDPTVPSPD